MSPEEIRSRISAAELTFATSRSGGPGGQNVNKVNTKAEVRFDIIRSSVFTSGEKDKILSRLARRINSSGELIVVSQSERSQFLNRKKAEEKLFVMLAGALTGKTARMKTSPTRSSVIRRLKIKSVRSTLKKSRKPDISEFDD